MSIKTSVSKIVTIIRYVDLVVLIKRNGVVIDGCTTYTPFRPERPIQTTIFYGFKYTYGSSEGVPFIIESS